MMKRQLFYGFIISVVVVVTAWSANRSGLTAHGSLQFDGAGWYRDIGDIDSAVSFSGSNMLTLSIKTPLLKTAKIEGLIDVYQLYGTYAQQVMAADPQQEGIFLEGRAPIITDLRMLYGALYLPWADITLGRQIVNYGKGTLFSPIDVFSVVNIFDLSFKRSGSDIAMAAIPVGDMSGVDLVTELPIGDSDYASSLRGFTTLAGWDLSALAIYRHRSREAIGGLALKGDLIAGVTAEAVVRYDRNLQKWSSEAMAGIDYSLKNSWIFGAEYYYRQHTDAHPIHGRHNLFGSVRYVINDLMTISAVVIGVLPQENVLATLQYSWNILQSVNTIFYTRYYHLKNVGATIPQAEAGGRVEISF